MCVVFSGDVIQCLRIHFHLSAPQLYHALMMARTLAPPRLCFFPFPFPFPFHLGAFPRVGAYAYPLVNNNENPQGDGDEINIVLEVEKF